jgi:DNA polymerase
MQIVLDFETYYSKDYTLKKLGVLGYIRDPRFMIHGVGIQIDANDPEWWTDELKGKLKSIDWSDVTLVGHNLYFDATILFEQFGIVAAHYHDTMSMGKALIQPGAPASLSNLAKTYGLGDKIAGTLDQVKGVVDLDKDTEHLLMLYCLQDVLLTKELYERLLPETPTVELDLIDLTIRMAVAPVLELNPVEVDLAVVEATTEQQEAIANSGVSQAVLSSNQKFAAHLESLDIEVPIKISPTTGKETTALGQNDPEFIEVMAAHPELSNLWEGRAAAKSNLPITRAHKWHFIANNGSRKMPMPMRYYGAHTGRWSGMDGINVQNLPRKSRLRKAIRAPRGHVILVGDSSQIELRMNAWFSEQWDVLHALKSGQCVYRQMASYLFHKQPSDITSDERQFGKVVVLGCGYGMGWRRFQHYCASGPLGMKPMKLSDFEARRTIQTYRDVNSAIVDIWQMLNEVIEVYLYEDKLTNTHRSVKFGHERVVLPNGRYLDYKRLKYEEVDDFGKKWKYHRFQRVCALWGGTLLENIIQALARIVVAEQMLEVDKLEGVRVVGCTHDEIIAVCPEEIAEERFTNMIGIMSTPPVWAPDVPLAAEGGWARNYSK